MDAVFNSAPMHNIRKHAQLRQVLKGVALKSIEHVRADNKNSAYECLDILEKEYDKPWLRKQLAIAKVDHMTVPENELNSADKLLSAKEFITHLKKTHLECKSTMSAADYEAILDKVIEKMGAQPGQRKLLVKFYNQCQYTAETKHADYFKGHNMDLVRMNHGFSEERYLDFIYVMEKHVLEQKQLAEVGPGGSLNSSTLAKSAKDSLKSTVQAKLKDKHEVNMVKPGKLVSTNHKKGRNQNMKTPTTGKRDNKKDIKKDKKNLNQRPKQVNTVQAAKGQPGKASNDPCIFCKRNDHYTPVCSNPNKLTPDTMLRNAIFSNKCIKCLGRDFHISSKCEKRGCRKEGCIEDHHTLLHGADFSKIKEYRKSMLDRQKSKQSYHVQKTTKKSKAPKPPTAMHAESQEQPVADNKSA